MPDRDDLGQAWQLPPSRYLHQRPAPYGIGAPAACYVTMRDGVRLAVDVYLPEGAPRPQRVPAIVILTPYYRRFQVTGPGAEPAPNIAIYRDMFVPRGYALVTVDVRGCGASFGTRDCFRSPRERDDHREIADWIVAQPWSSGVIGSTGISYLGAAACFLASTGHPAVKAIAPICAVHDTYTDHVFPGGIKCTTVTENYDELVEALDQDKRDMLAPYPYFNDKRYAGPAPVDEDTGGKLLAAAIAGHADSFKMRDLAPEFAFREGAASHDPALHSGAFSPYWYLGDMPGQVNVLSISGWYDGSAFANGSIARFLSNPGADNRLLLGPWDHGARTNGSPFRDSRPLPEFPVLAEILRFFDEHLAGMDTGLRDEAPVHFHTVRGEKWQAATSWPPHPANTRMFLAADGVLASQAPGETAVAAYQASFTTATGRNSRFERLGALPVVDYYKDWNGREERMLSFATAPFARDTELTGHATVQLHVSTSEHDAGLFVYLSEVDADGRSWFITEGLLRLLHRTEGQPPAGYQATWPWRSFRREDARHMQPGVPETVRFALLPVSWTLQAGSRLRVAIAGADADHFAQVTPGRPPSLEFTLGGANASFIDLPLRG
ncbi:CocE/NonD family hydrolase [Ramlibacter sp. G-1-2-2]|uniref:CocE/NonD family hydrolase n=1 Tax=Ramlibacter agri TaxID=2728837 RepID=A0A848HFF7_9BURK|nr:CocE/NonD family hydrolase [Ramlibacter agri]NML48179.1 CocE/NonD family hydrolase [Ramlibacter agri]